MIFGFFGLKTILIDLFQKLYLNTKFCTLTAGINFFIKMNLKMHISLKYFYSNEALKA